MTGETVLLVLCLSGLVVGGALWLSGLTAASDAAWLAATAVAAVASAVWVVRALLRRSLGSDVVALLALVGSALVGELLAGAIVAVMLTGGRVLEDRAARRARRDLSELVSRAPRVAHRVDGDRVTAVPAEEVRPGDVLLVLAGEALPVDGRVTEVTAVVDESVVTGEPLPVERSEDQDVRGGTVNAGGPFRMRATTDAEGSSFSAIVRLAREAESRTAPFVRMADRYAAVFLPFTLLLTGAAWWLSGDAVRAVAVLVVATPCPLILAAPVAFTSGMSRSARRGVIVRGGAALERLAHARVLLFDKTGTVTEGRPVLGRVVTGEDASADEVLRLAASLDQASPHVLASAIVRAARDRGVRLEQPGEVVEELGRGIGGTVGGRPVRVGKAVWAGGGGAEPGWAARARAEAARDGSVTVFVGVDGALCGVLLLRDRLRADAPRTLRLLRLAGIERAVMVTGDRRDVAERIAAHVGADAVYAEQSPADKVAVARDESARAPTVMVGDGVNDAPALAAAGVGVALGARGSTASSEAADVVVTVDRLTRVAESLAVARRTLAIARQSAAVGMLLSAAAMAVAAAGLLPPAAGALTQEAIDVAVILNALRALSGGRGRRVPELRGDDADLVRALQEEHVRLWPGIESLPHAAEALTRREGDQSAVTAGLRDFIDALAAHEERDEHLLYPRVARALGGPDTTAAMSRGHTEIAELCLRLRACLDEVDGVGGADARRRAARLAVELYAVLRLHFAQEEESFHVLADPEGHGGRGDQRPGGPEPSPPAGGPRAGVGWWCKAAARPKRGGRGNTNRRR
ncbi:heavy metal translocating P-type ATPase [Nocardiopsis sp. RV163]|uniref:heavy metal translocating P-type ATPase n=1 Tax=Nocardiopsis sp. RV163 TaxID=1661388 RepID=UPI001F33F2F0|nr:heavy metal translocating P-type ATPase [Nocardiopsis sp. RV163]